MALWTMILRKMANNKWLQLNLWFGLTICVALFCSMPLYSDAIMQRTLQKELQLVTYRDEVYPGFIRIRTTVSRDMPHEQTIERLIEADRFAASIPRRMGLEAISAYQQKFTYKLKVYGADATEQERQLTTATGGFRALSDLEDRVRLVTGRFPEIRSDGVFEAVVSERFLLATRRHLNDELILEATSDDLTEMTFRVIPVGVINTDPEADPYLPFLLQDNYDGFFIPYEQFESEFVHGRKLRIQEAEWRFAINYEQMTVDDVARFINTDRDIRRYFQNRLGIGEINIPARDTVASFIGIQGKLDIMMLALYAPVMLMLAFYLYMAANLIIERQKTEISVFRSRGASRLQIMFVYTIESLILGLSALAVGPFIGVAFTKILGASSGFLEFVQRAALEVSLNSDAYKIAIAAVSAAIILILIPAFLATRVSIVTHKQQMARANKLSFWHKMGLDFILVGFAVYLLYNFNQRQEDLKQLALDSDALQIDPLLFLMPAVFALGGGLLLLRVYPWFIRLIYWIGRRWWSPALYHSLVQISRSSGQYLTISVFLVMTVATGLFSANAARTINDNIESKIRYSIGADIALMTRWESNAPGPASVNDPQSQQPQQQSGMEFGDSNVIQYAEPPLQPLRELEGIESLARVFIKETGPPRFYDPKSGKSAEITLIGISTKEFGETTWMKDGLMDYHINSYLNLIASNPKAILISRSIADLAKVEPGEILRIYWPGTDQVEFQVYGIIDYWPSWNPLPRVTPRSGGRAEAPHLVVGHLNTIQNRLALEPYYVWLKLKEGVTSQEIYEQIIESKVPVISLRDANQELIDSMNDPFRMAINGVMTLGFVISMVISFFGFLLFWLLTLSGRTLQYGVLRAMGIPFGQIIGMLISEQVLTSGAAILIGVFIGNLTSDLYVPLFEMSFSTTEQVPPFQIVRELSDYLQLYGIIGFMLVFGLGILCYRLSRVRIAQALKLGEE